MNPHRNDGVTPSPRESYSSSSYTHTKNMLFPDNCQRFILLIPVGHAPSELGVYGQYPLDVDTDYAFLPAWGERVKTLLPVGHAPPGLGVYGQYPLDVDTDL